MEFVTEERKKNVVYPPKDLMFSWMHHCSIRDVKVVILGQDPYHGPKQAHGLCFSVQVLFFKFVEVTIFIILTLVLLLNIFLSSHSGKVKTKVCQLFLLQKDVYFCIVIERVFGGL